MPEIDCNVYTNYSQDFRSKWCPRLKWIPWLFFDDINFDARNINNRNKVYHQITLINENPSFLSEQLAEDDMKTNDSDNESFLSDQSLCFTLLGSDRSLRLKQIPRLFFNDSNFDARNLLQTSLPLICPNIYIDVETPIFKPMFDDRNCSCKFTLYGPFGTCFVSEMADEDVSVYHDDRKFLMTLKLLKLLLPNY